MSAGGHKRRKRQPEQKQHAPTCYSCGVRTYPTRAAAKAESRHTGRALSAYPCPDGPGFHVGRLAPAVKAGIADRRNLT